MQTWKTSDVDEIVRRKIPAEIEKFEIQNCESSNPYFSTLCLSTHKGKEYRVEIRSLTHRLNSCDCPDYCHNGLGTCKHIEHLLLRLQKRQVRAFKKAAAAGSFAIEIFLNRIDEPKIQLLLPADVNPSIAKVVEPFFSSDGSFLGDPVERFAALEEAVACYQQRGGSSTEARARSIRISSHIATFIEYQKINAEKQTAKETFMKDFSLGKRSMKVVKYPLLPYQQEGMLHLAFTERTLLADDMGLGKTVQAIATSDLLRQLRNIQRVLVVTTASLKAEWEDQIAKFTDLPSLLILGVRPKRLK